MTAPQHSEAEARDAYVAVEMTLSNGHRIKVRPPLFDEAIPILLQLDGFLTGAPVAATLVPALKAFYLPRSATNGPAGTAETVAPTPGPSPTPA